MQTDASISRENRQVFLLSLGCAKNLVDSECMSHILRDAGFIMVDDPSQADILLVNTCGFIESAKKEAIESISNWPIISSQTDAPDT
jgi:ribosomal protein S12 methylthiotransferase